MTHITKLNILKSFVKNNTLGDIEDGLKLFKDASESILISFVIEIKKRKVSKPERHTMIQEYKILLMNVSIT